jgi:enamine deaminase RidA (YjgF/YER057c/UK114 family)
MTAMQGVRASARFVGKDGISEMSVERRLSEMGLVLPEVMKVPTGVRLPFNWVRVVGKRATISGHGPSLPDGSVAGPFGKVGSDLSLEQGYEAARLTALAMLASLRRELGSLDHVTWLRAFGMVNAAPGFQSMPAVINGFSDLILSIFGPERGQHARSAIGVAELPFGIPVEIEAEVVLD